MTLLFVHRPSTPALSAVMAAAVVLMGAAAPAAHAQTGQPSAEGGLRLAEGVLLYPSVKLSAGRDDNVRAVNEGAISSTATVLAPALKVEAKNPSGLYTLGYNGTYTRYSSLSSDNTNNHDFAGSGAHEFSARSRLNWSLGYQDRVDPRADAVVASAEPDQWRGQNLRALYSYGANQAKGRIETAFSASRKRYQNNLATTANSDVDTQQVEARYFWRVMPRTFLVAEARLGMADYRVGTANNNTDTRLLAGVTWQATAKTTGQVKVGRQQKDFDSAAKTDASGATYEMSVEWKPLSYSVFTVTAERSLQEALSVGDYNQSRSLGLAWSHQWNSLLTSRVGLNDARANFVNSARSDDTLTTSAGIVYSLGRRYALGLDLVHTQRDSTQSVNAYKRNSVLVSINAAL